MTTAEEERPIGYGQQAAIDAEGFASSVEDENMGEGNQGEEISRPVSLPPPSSVTAHKNMLPPTSQPS
eukprot:5388046-Prorocentrum_lima.AAC.1